ncbi:MAG: phosphotransferase-like protein [Chlamydiia bacterium]
MTPKSFQIIYLNGPSSSGKSTFAKDLQAAFEAPFLHVGIDRIIAWMPEKFNNWTGEGAVPGFSWKKSIDSTGHVIHELQQGPFAEQMGATFQQVVLTLARLGHYLIIDDVSFGKAKVDEWKRALHGHPVLWVGVNAPLAILEEREKARGNRIIGSARAQFHQVHVDATYDVEIDTHHFTFQENLEKIHEAVSQIKGEITHRQVSRIGVYGVVRRGEKILVVTQPKGPYKGRFDLPGGKVEFGETPEETLHREFLEEVGGEFDSAELLTNLAIKIEVPSINGLTPYTFHQIGMIYLINDLSTPKTGELEYSWINMSSLKKENSSPFLGLVVDSFR